MLKDLLKDKVVCDQPLELELQEVRRLGMEHIFVALHKPTQYMRENHIPFYTHGTVASTYLAYLLGISAFNPVDFNLDGIQFFGTPSDERQSTRSSINLVVPNERFDEIVCRLKADATLSQAECREEKQSFHIENITIVHLDLGKSDDYDFAEVDMESLRKFALDWCQTNLLDGGFQKLYGNDQVPLTDLVKFFGLSLGTWGFDDVIAGLQSLQLPLSAAPVFYDDVYDLLLETHPKEVAFAYADGVHMGRQLPESVTATMDPAVVAWCNHAVYLFPRSHAMECLIARYRLAK